MDSIVSIIEENYEAREAGLAHLCEFIEDCEHTVLATKILYMLGQEGPRTQYPYKYIRFIYNRVILENPAVRAGMLRVVGSGGGYVCVWWGCGLRVVFVAWVGGCGNGCLLSILVC